MPGASISEARFRQGPAAAWKEIVAEAQHLKEQALGMVLELAKNGASLNNAFHRLATLTLELMQAAGAGEVDTNNPMNVPKYGNPSAGGFSGGIYIEFLSSYWPILARV